MSQQKKKPMFTIKYDDENVIVSAGGTILYRINNNQLELLLMTNRGKYEDLGGTADLTDIDIYHTVAREVFEESNGLINYNDILSRIKKSNFIVSKTSKYILFIIPANADEINLKTEDFGDREIHDNIPRTISWVPLSEFLNKNVIRDKLNFRLKNRNIFEYLKKLEQNITNTNNTNTTNTTNNTSDIAFTQTNEVNQLKDSRNNLSKQIKYLF